MAYTTDFRSKVLNLLKGDGLTKDDININYLALGDGLTPASASDTQLESEQFRKLVDSQSIETDLLKTITDLLTGEANTFDINEIGIFANATATPNSGLLVSRIVLSSPIFKTNAISVSMIRTDKVVV